MTALLLDTHVFFWWLTDPGRISAQAMNAMEESDAVSPITWYELSCLVEKGRILLPVPLRA